MFYHAKSIYRDEDDGWYGGMVRQWDAWIELPHDFNEMETQVK